MNKFINFIKEDGKLLFIIFLSLSSGCYYSYYNGKQIGKFQLCEELNLVNAVDSTGSYMCVSELEITNEELMPYTLKNQFNPIKSENINKKIINNSNISIDNLIE